MFGDAGQVAQDVFGVLHRLYGLAQDDDVEAVVVEILQALFQVGLYDVDAGGDGSQHAFGVDFHAVAGALFFPNQCGQQFAAAAAEVEYAAARRYPVVNQP